MLTGLSKDCSCILVILLSLALCGCRLPSSDLQPDRVIDLAPDIVEPSDICLHPDGQSLLIVSDKGYLYQTDFEGSVLLRAPFEGGDFEGVYAYRGKIFVADESNRLVHRFDPDGLVLEQTYHIPYAGKRNSGYESIVYNRARQTFVLITEKNPIIIFEVDDDFQVSAAFPFEVTSDISAATWHEDHLWLVSDEEQAVLQLDPDTYEVVGRWGIPAVAKPEGIVFVGDDLLVVCDKEHLLYYFPAPSA